MANCSIWVEGITYRIYIKAYLNAYCNSKKFKYDGNETIYKEDIDFSFFEYAGSNVAHYFFGEDEEEKTLINQLRKENKLDDIDFINGKFCHNHIFLLTDEDNNSKANRHKLLTKWSKDEKIGFGYHRLKSREIENLITFKRFNEVKKKIFPKLKKLYIKEDDCAKRYNEIESRLVDGKGKKKRSNGSNKRRDDLSWTKSYIGLCGSVQNFV